MTAGNRLPPWLKTRLTTGPLYAKVLNRVRERNLHTVCQSAACPNRNECWNAGTATFLILGDRCTRSCRFCNIPSGNPATVDLNEPYRVAEAIAALDLSYAVITSVTRDDLPDGGAEMFADTIRSIRCHSPRCRVEVLIPDFQGSATSLGTVLEASPDVLNHNVETVPALYSRIRPQALYRRSLQLLQRAKERGSVTKTGLMLGLGETTMDVQTVMKDLRLIGCDILTLGQYLQPSARHQKVERFYPPSEFEELKNEALRLGFRHVAAGPLVRSSYKAACTNSSGIL